MLHELKSLLFTAKTLSNKNIPSLLVTVVALDGSSYRRPGVCMLVAANGQMFGAVSGGCVEKEIKRQAQEVFATSIPKLMIYDGRYRLGCEGVLYILIEPIIQAELLSQAVQQEFTKRRSITLSSFYQKKEGLDASMGSLLELENGTTISLRKEFSKDKAQKKLSHFSNTLKPALRLVIVGAEHDAVALTQAASNIGMTVTIIAPPDDPKTLENFPGATDYFGFMPEQLKSFDFDKRTAVVLMTHSYSKDLQYLGNLIKSELGYIGLLGPHKRREQLLNDLLEHYPDASYEFIDSLHGPAGLNIGAESAAEIAISILAEVLAVMRGQEPGQLKNKSTGIHD